MHCHMLVHEDDGMMLQFEVVDEATFFDEKNSIELRTHSYPNPFTSSTTIEYKLQQPEKVSLTIYNHLGQLVYQTQGNQLQGQRQLQWNAEGCAEGIYYYKFQVGNEVANGKMVKVK
jgi:hypothetical protein